MKRYARYKNTCIPASAYHNHLVGLLGRVVDMLEVPNAQWKSWPRLARKWEIASLATMP